MSYFSHGKKINIPLNIIIFSKDRACQLDLLLTSMHKMFKEYAKYNINVLYTSSSDEYESAYARLKRMHQHVIFIREQDFRDDLISQIKPENTYTIFLVDDDVWKEPFTIECNELDALEDDDVLCMSLRLDQNLTYCYTLNVEMEAPDLSSSPTWKWGEFSGDFGYPMSLDGHIFRTKDIIPLVSRLPYNNPNTLEAALSKNPPDRHKLICMKKAPIFNIPINKVQTQYSNRHGSVSAEHLNKLFNSYYRISLAPLIGYNNKACHQEVDLKMKRSIPGAIKYFLNRHKLPNDVD